jgi:hypothetical protein
MNKNKRLCPRRLRRRGHIVYVLVNTVIIAIKLSSYKIIYISEISAIARFSDKDLLSE